MPQAQTSTTQYLKLEQRIILLCGATLAPAERCSGLHPLFGFARGIHPLRRSAEATELPCKARRNGKSLQSHSLF